MSFCKNCGKELSENVAFCEACGTAVAESTPATTERTKEKQEFLDLTHRYLRWEQKVWKIFGFVYLGIGALYSLIFSLYHLIGLISFIDGDEATGIIFITMGLLYMILFGGMFFGLAIVHFLTAKKINLYLDTLYTDFSLTYNRCSSIGMMIFCIFFSSLTFAFFLVNFIRMKDNKELVEKCMAVTSDCIS